MGLSWENSRDGWSSQRWVGLGGPMGESSANWNGQRKES